MKVWRVAHGTVTWCGFPTGPYSCGGLTEEAVKPLLGMGLDHTPAKQPSPYEDRSIRGIDSTERCGFNSREALDEWFDGWTNELSACGFEVWEYDVPDSAARAGRRGQVVFVASEAVEIRHSPFKPVQLTLWADA
ncbi:hypothetical protein SEA_HEATHER_41 [Streptomyces phage Heather]|uniref:Uncharacterized protein n=1 Tax=Streptomyces phage Heather TaxID=2562343 RepID=A0A4D6E4J4_9CAUD|nr:hypothetical protein SEA_HEATHER_41 [Streptomyces phage Heather]